MKKKKKAVCANNFLEQVVSSTGVEGSLPLVRIGQPTCPKTVAMPEKGGEVSQN